MKSKTEVKNFIKNCFLFFLNLSLHSILNINKIYQLVRYISSNEAIWCILDFKIHERHTTVVNLAIHLGQRVYFTEYTTQNIVENTPETSLTAFYKLCQSDLFAQILLYVEIPVYYTWPHNRWSRQKQGAQQDEGWEENAVFRSKTISTLINRSASFYICYCTLSEVLHHSQTFKDITEKSAPNMDYWRTMPTGEESN